MIYELLLVSNYPITRTCPTQPEEKHWDHLDHPYRCPGFCTTVLRLNRQIYHEASAVLYGGNQFHFYVGEWYYYFVRERKEIFTDDELWRELKAIAPRNLRQMTDLSVSIFTYGLGGPTPTVRRRILQSLTDVCDELEEGHHLRSFNVKVEYLWETWGRYMEHPASKFAKQSTSWCRYTSKYVDENVAKRTLSLLKPFLGLRNIDTVFLQAPLQLQAKARFEEMLEGSEVIPRLR